MAIISFPDIELADENGLLAMGGDLEVESLLLAYKSGIFPWPFDETVLVWFAPPRRALLFLDEFHPSKSLLRENKKAAFTIRIDHDFESVIRNCAELKNRGRQRGTWITEDMIEAYTEFHRAGYAHSIECYQGEKLIGGMYGVAIGRMFAGESMFYRQPNASKLCMLHLVELLKAKGVKWIDCQVMTPFLKAFGAREVTRKQFMELLVPEVGANVKLF